MPTTTVVARSYASPVTGDLHQSFVELALEWGTLHQNLLESDPKKANALFDRITVIRKDLAATENGRNALTALLQHPAPVIRLKAATACLGFDPDSALNTLVHLEQESSAGIYAFEAEMVRREFEAGRLRP